MQRMFEKAVDYCTNRLKNKSQLYNSIIASKVTKFVRKLRSQLKEMDFGDSSSIITFLKVCLDPGFRLIFTKE